MGTTCRRQILGGHLIDIIAEFKAHMLERFIGPDEGEGTEYLGCELVRDRKACKGQLIQAGYAERVLRIFNMWECNPAFGPQRTVRSVRLP